MSKDLPKRGRGRPPKIAAELFDVSIYVRMTAADKIEIDRAAELSGQLSTRWARAVLLKAARRIIRESK